MKRLMVALGIVGLLIMMSFSPHLTNPIEEGCPSQQSKVAPPSETEFDIDASVMMKQIEPYFSENRGQLEEGVGRYYSIGNPFSVSFSDGWVAYTIRDNKGSSRLMFRMIFEDSNEVCPIGEEPFNHHSNYLKGETASDWVTYVRNFGKVVYEDLWDNIDLEFYHKGGRIKFDFIVHPGADPSSIGYSYEGVEGIEIDKSTGDLLIQTLMGVVREASPVSIQYHMGDTTDVSTAFDVNQHGRISFTIEQYDVGMPLVIDPGLEYSTVIGGNLGKWNGEEAYTVKTDSQGNIYIAGFTTSTNFPTTSGAIQTGLGGRPDGFIAKFNRNCSKLLFSTYIGGTGGEIINDIFVDDSGMVYACGYTSSGGIPKANTGWDSTMNSYNEAFIIALNITGSKVDYGTYLGGSRNQSISDIWVDDNGYIYGTGWTTSSDFPTTNGCLDGTHNGSIWDHNGYVVKLNSTLKEAHYSTFIGGNSECWGTAIWADNSGRAYVTGSTEGNFDTTPGAYNTGSSRSGTFVLRLNANGTALDFAATLGVQDDVGHGIHVNDNGTIIVSGENAKAGFPTTKGAFCETVKANSSASNVFVTMFNHNCSSIIWSTLVGGSGYDGDWQSGLWYYEGGTALAVDDEGCSYVTGVTSNSPEFPVTATAYDYNYSRTESTFIFKLSSNGSKLLYSTRIRSSHGTDLVLDSKDSVIVTGRANYRSFPTTQGAYNTSVSQSDAYVLKLNLLVDSTPPAILDDLTKDRGGTGDIHQMKVKISDKWGLDKVRVEYWFGNATDHINETMELDDGSIMDGQWVHNLIIPSNFTAPIHYILHATDTSWNTNSTAMKTITVFDNDDPVVSSNTQGNASTGESFTFAFEVIDNIGVEDVNLTYWFGGSTSNATTIEMNGTDLDNRRNGNYTLTIIIPSNFTGVLSYYLTPSDTSDNKFRTLTYQVEVVDNDEPLLMVDHTNPTATTGDVFKFSIEVMDNIGIERVNVTYWWPTLGGSMKTEGMVSDRPTGRGNGTYNLTISIPSYHMETFVYRFDIVDLSENILTSVNNHVKVVDNDLPIFESDFTTTTTDNQTIISFLVKVSDNIGIDRVKVNYWFEGKGLRTVTMETDNVTTTGNGTYSLLMTLHWYENGRFNYNYSIIDTSENMFHSDTNGFLVGDLEPPMILASGTIGGLKGSTLTIWAEVRDDIGIEEVRLIVAIEGITPMNISISGDGNYTFDLLVDRDSPNLLIFRFEAKDVGWNWNVTPDHELTLYNDPPTIENVPVWEVVEEERTTLDLTPYIKDDNDALHLLTLDTVSQEASILGYTVAIRVMDWRPDFPLEILISDGEDTTSNYITVHIINVNDPPTIDTSIPQSITAKEDEVFEIVIEANDPDGDTLVWEDDCPLFNISGEGTISFTPVQSDIGTYDVTLTVSDGNGSTDHIRFELFIENVNDPPTITNIAPATGSIFNLGEFINFTCEVEDEDGDTLIITWYDGDRTIGEGHELRDQELTEGMHTITLRVTDGEAADERSITIEVQNQSQPPDDNGKDDIEAFNFTWLIIGILVSIIIVAAVLVIRKRMD